jgi:hypothetical protein
VKALEGMTMEYAVLNARRAIRRFAQVPYVGRWRPGLLAF